MPHRLRSFSLLVAIGACATQGAGTQGVYPGIEVLVTDSAHLVRGKRVGILTNQTGVDRSGRGDVERLLAAGVRLTAIFSPEHGFRGVLDREGIEHGFDSATGLPVFSLYGAVRAPTPEMLGHVDVLLIDLQDIGARTYTYVSTALLTLRAAGAAGVPVVLLDRPNPIGGEAVSGPVMDTAFASFVGMLPVPLRHGMTLGELMRLGTERLGIKVPLTIVPASGWRRGQWFDATGLPWVRPSPNMPDLESATHYPGLVLLEGTNLSVGRGTPIAFQVAAAPWLDAARLVRVLEGVPGVRARDTMITPQAPGDGKYAGKAIPAVRFTVTDRAAYDPTALVVRLMAEILHHHRDSLAFNNRFDALAGTDGLRRAILAGDDPAAIVAAWAPALDGWRRERDRFLLYR